MSRDETASDDLERHSVGSALISTSAISLLTLDTGAVVSLGKRGLDDVGRTTEVDNGIPLEAVPALADDLEGDSDGAALRSTSWISLLACDAGAEVGLGKRGSDDVGRATDDDIVILSEIPVVSIGAIHETPKCLEAVLALAGCAVEGFGAGSVHLRDPSVLTAPTAELSATWIAESRRVLVSGAGEDEAGAVASPRPIFSNPRTRCAVRMGVRLRERVRAPMRISGALSGMKCFPHAARTVMHQ